MCEINMNEHQKVSCFNSRKTSILKTFFKFKSTEVHLLSCLICLSEKCYIQHSVRSLKLFVKGQLTFFFPTVICEFVRHRDVFMANNKKKYLPANENPAKHTA